MDRYTDFSVEDFVWDDFFRQWTLLPTPESDTIWNNLIDNNPEMHEKIEQAKAIVLSLRVQEPEITHEEISESVRQTVGRITSAEAAKNPFPGNVKPLFTNWLRFAASIACIALLGWTVYFVSKKQNTSHVAQTKIINSPGDPLVEKRNTTSKTILLTLSDGSRISLAPDARVRYPEIFSGERREVFLEGEAFFDIAKDPEHPFLVFSNGLITKVLGTSFRVKSIGNGGEVTVEVKTGKVSVFAESDPDVKEKMDDTSLQGIVLKPNQKVIYASNEVKMVKTLVEKPEIVVAKADVPRFDYEDTPASDVFGILGKTYGIDIIYDAALLEDCPLTARLDGLTLHDKLNIICKAVESSYEIVDGQVIIHSKGCKN